MTRALVLDGKKFGRLLVLHRVEKSVHGYAKWLCRCECGVEKAVPAGSLNSGAVRSCGCLNRELMAERCRARATHGKRHVPEYSVWTGMKQRCNKPEHHNYPRYGGRGIKVCERWKSFENFYADMGSRPTPQHTIERIDGDGNYEPDNCKWATVTEQANNRCSNRLVEYQNLVLTIAEAIRMAGTNINKHTVRRRLDKGWPDALAIDTPPTDTRFKPRSAA